MKKWLLAWVVFTAYLITNMTVMESAERPHLAATLLLGFFFYLIFGIRGVYGSMAAVSTIVLLAMLVHQLHHSPYGAAAYYGDVLFRLGLDLIMLMGGGGLGYWTQRLFYRRA